MYDKFGLHGERWLEGRLSECTVLPILVAGAEAARSLTSTIRTISHLSLPPFPSSAPSLVCGWVFSLTSRQAVKFTQRLAEGRAPLHLAPPARELIKCIQKVGKRQAHFRISRAIEMELNTLPPLLSSVPALFPHSSTLFPPLPGRVVCATLLSCLLLAQPSPGHVQWPPLSLPALFSPQSRRTVFPLLGAIPGCSLQWESCRAALQLDPISGNHACRQAGAGAASPSWSSSLAGLLRQPRHGT